MRGSPGRASRADAEDGDRDRGVSGNAVRRNVERGPVPARLGVVRDDDLEVDRLVTSLRRLRLAVPGHQRVRSRPSARLDEVAEVERRLERAQLVAVDRGRDHPSPDAGGDHPGAFSLTSRGVDRDRRGTSLWERSGRGDRLRGGVGDDAGGRCGGEHERDDGCEGGSKGHHDYVIDFAQGSATPRASGVWG